MKYDDNIQGVPKKTVISVQGSVQGVKWPQLQFSGLSLSPETDL